VTTRAAWLLGGAAVAVTLAACIKVDPVPVVNPESFETPEPAASAKTARRSDPEAVLDGGSGRPNRGSKGERIGARHILIQWMGSEKAAPSIVRTRDQARILAEQLLLRAKSNEDFARLAVEFSDEPGAAGRGGALGVFPRGQMVKAFEDAAFRLQVNEISSLVETPFGFHIIQRTE
jgi:NIMA-interacting peptidyl-prolyl cis-trans isomerase 1